MSVNLSQKEKMLLGDQKKHEQVCIQKYQNYAAQAQDPQLKQLLQSYAQQEQQHLDTINQIMSGQVPSMNQGQQQGQQSQQQATSSTQGSQQATSSAQNAMGVTSSTQSQQQATSSSQSQMGATSSTQSGMGASSSASSSGSANAQDAAMLNDMLMTEKFVSNAYDTAIFEFTDSNVRQALNHIQKEEQQHGEGIFNYMQNNGMYNVNQ